MCMPVYSLKMLGPQQVPLEARPTAELGGGGGEAAEFATDGICRLLMLAVEATWPPQNSEGFQNAHVPSRNLCPKACARRWRGWPLADPSVSFGRRQGCGAVGLWGGSGLRLPCGHGSAPGSSHHELRSSRCSVPQSSGRAEHMWDDFLSSVRARARPAEGGVFRDRVTEKKEENKTS